MEREITLKDYGRVLWRGRWLILATTVAAGIVGLLLTFASDVTYTATARVFVGQATTATGAVVATPETSPEFAPVALETPEIAAQAAKEIGISPSRVRRDVTVSSTRIRGVGNLPTVATITFTDQRRRVAREGANAYAEAVVAAASQSYDRVVATYRERLQTARRDSAAADAEITRYKAQLASASADRAVALQTLLLAAIEQRSLSANEIGLQEVNIAKAEQQEQPYVVDAATGTTSSGSPPRRARTVGLAAALGLIIGIVIAFVWRGPSVGRDASGPPADSENRTPAA